MKTLLIISRVRENRLHKRNKNFPVPSPVKTRKCLAKALGESRIITHLTFFTAIMKTALAPLLLLGLLFAGSPAQAETRKSVFEKRCEAEMLPRIDVRAVPLNYQINNSVASRLLYYRSAHVYSGEMMLGSTSLQKTSMVEFDGPSLIDKANDRECVAPRVAVTLTFRPVNVYIAREFQPDTCPYNKVLEHEMRHVRVYEEEVPRMTAFVKEQLQLRYGQHPLYARAGKGLDQLQQDVDTWLRPLIAAELDRIEALQLSLDTFEEKTTMSQACLGQVAENLRASY